ncbi:hypothetical protein Goshw_026171 [Gossypium schwendimanii]|uniref:BHLH domain-containing protein n=1 Tax=Gossypium schwendimanii TaxID=34291 RepID=A0A7J9LRH4_GOSSC|nr:hypothetical protein [Gossypium schwendimanii]
MELLNQFPELKSLNYQSFSPFSTTDNNLFNNEAQKIPTINNWGEEDNNLPGFTHNSVPSVSQPIFTPGNEFHEETHKRKELDFAWETSFWNSSSPHVYDTEINIRNNPGRGKSAKSNGKEEEKPKEVVHVRARRGQATNSHCVAERSRIQFMERDVLTGVDKYLQNSEKVESWGAHVIPLYSHVLYRYLSRILQVRRGKINERLRSLQDIVPGCYRNMGMAVMLDEIINYVQFLQNQIEFLSMKLTAASACHDFNSDSDDMEIMQMILEEIGFLMEEVFKVSLFEQLIKPSNKGIVLKMSMLDFSPQFLSPDSMESPQRVHRV